MLSLLILSQPRFRGREEERSWKRGWLYRGDIVRFWAMELCVSYGVYITLPLRMPSRALRVVQKVLFIMLPKSCQTLGVDMLFSQRIRRQMKRIQDFAPFFMHGTISSPDPARIWSAIVQNDRGHWEGDCAWIWFLVYPSNCDWLTGLFAWFSDTQKKIRQFDSVKTTTPREILRPRKNYD